MIVRFGGGRVDFDGRWLDAPRAVLCLGYHIHDDTYGATLLWRLRPYAAQGESLYERRWSLTFVTRDFVEDFGRWWWLAMLSPVWFIAVPSRSPTKAWTGREREFRWMVWGYGPYRRIRYIGAV